MDLLNAVVDGTEHFVVFQMVENCGALPSLARKDVLLSRGGTWVLEAMWASMGVCTLNTHALRRAMGIQDIEDWVHVTTYRCGFTNRLVLVFRRTFLASACLRKS